MEAVKNPPDAPDAKEEQYEPKKLRNVNYAHEGFGMGDPRLVLLLQKANLARQQGNCIVREKFLREALKISQGNGRAWIALAESLIAQKKLNEILAIITKINN